MVGTEFTCFSYWWIFPVVLIILCFIMMIGGRGSFMPCGCGFGRTRRRPPIHGRESAREILDRQYALGEIGREEYEERKKTINEE
jgi:putative membrane protein